MKTADRNSNIELLRIFSMFIIVLYHCILCCDRGGGQCVAMSIFANEVWNRTLSMFGGLGVNLFVLISGYCLIKDDTGFVSIFKLLKFYGQLLFYSVCIAIPYIIFVKHSVSLSEIMAICFPISNETWWFASAYFVLLVLHPFINQFLRSIDKKRYQHYLIVVFLIVSVIPFYSYFSSRLALFVCLYSLSAYVKLHGANSKIKHTHYVVAAILAMSFIVISSYIIESIPSISGKCLYFYGARQIPVLILSFSIFMSFLTMKQFHSKVVNTIGLSTFGVYLISDHEIVRNIIWTDWLSKITNVDSLYFIPKSLVFTIAVFICCSAIDIIRHSTIERLYLKSLTRILEKTRTVSISIRSSINRILFGTD